MKTWSIDEFLAECEKLCWNEYTYDYSNMPEGICNGHRVKPYLGAWHSIVIDGGICNMSAYSEKYPNGFTTYYVDGKKFTALEYVRHVLEKNINEEEK